MHIHTILSILGLRIDLTFYLPRHLLETPTYFITLGASRIAPEMRSDAYTRNIKRWKYFHPLMLRIYASDRISGAIHIETTYFHMIEASQLNMWQTIVANESM